MTAVCNIPKNMVSHGMEVHSSWTSAVLPEVWNDGEDLVYTYHGAQFDYTT